MKKGIVLLCFFICVIYNAQMKLVVRLEKNRENNNDIYEKNSIEITLINESSDKIAFPLNQEGLTPFFEGETCTQTQGMSDTYSVLPIISLIQNGKLINSERGLHHLDPVVGNKKMKIKNLYSLFIFLQPQQKFTYKLYFNAHEFYDSPYKVFYWYYKTQNNNNYDLSVRFCIDEKVYMKLSKSQIKKLSQYKLFNGTLISNNITYTEDIDFGEEYE